MKKIFTLSFLMALGVYSFGQFPGIPVYGIDLITTVDANGIADSSSVQCVAIGTVLGVDMRQGAGNGYDLTISDGTGGIALFTFNDPIVSGSAPIPTNYQIQPGDMIAVNGTISQFNGKIQHSMNQVFLLAMGANIPAPQPVTALDESTESELVIIHNLTLITPSQWPGPGSSGSGNNVDATNGVDTFSLRIADDVDLFGTPAPMGPFDMAGIGGQFDSSSPYTSGYQLLPRWAADMFVHPPPPMVEFASGGPGLVSEAIGSIAGALAVVGPMGTSTVTIRVFEGPGISTSDYTINNAAPVGTFALAFNPRSISTFSIGVIDDMLAEPIESIGLMIIGASNGYQVGAQNTWVMGIDESDQPLIPMIGFASAVTTVTEAAGQINIDVNVANAVGTATAVFEFATGPGFNSTDYTISIPVQPFTTFSMPISNGAIPTFSVTLNDDAIAETLEAFAFRIVSVDNGFSIGPISTFICFIQDNDVAIPSVAEFSAASASVSENVGAVTVSVSVANPIGTSTAVFEITGSPGLNTTDFTLSTGAAPLGTFSLPLTASAVATFDINVLDDAVNEFTETMTLELIGLSNGWLVGPQSTYSLTISDDDPITPTYMISEINSFNAVGVYDSIGVLCNIDAVVMGMNIGGGNAIFSIYDGEGMGVFKGGGFSNYNVNDGDNVRITGTVASFNGLLQLSATAIMTTNGTIAVPTPLVVTALDETTESELVQMNNVNITAGTWPSGGSANITITDGGMNDFTMRLDSDADAAKVAEPNGEISVIGYGGQFDSSSPFTSGYQLLPHFASQIIAANHGLLAPAMGTTISISGAGTNTVDMVWSTSTEQGGGAVTYTVMIDTPGQGFANPIIALPSGNAGMDTTASISFATLSTTMSALGLNIGDTAKLAWTVRAQNTLYNGIAAEGLVGLEKGLITGTQTISQSFFKVYPNPSSGLVTVELNNSFEEYIVDVMDLKGSTIASFTKTGRANLNLSNLSNGVYTLRVRSENHNSVNRIVISK